MQFILDVEVFRHRQLVDGGEASPELVADLLQGPGHFRGVDAGGHHRDKQCSLGVYPSRYTKSQGQIALISLKPFIIRLQNVCIEFLHLESPVLSVVTSIACGGKHRG